MRKIAWILLLCSTVSCGLLGKKVSEDDCVKWDKHYREVLEAGVKKRAKGCDDAYKKKIPENVATSADGMATACRSVQKVGGYTSEEEKCFMAAEDPKDWKKCTFGKISSLGMYPKAAEGMLSSVDSFCGGKSNGDDDAPKSKKKKKKADEDDD
ncbi:MAG: hypothetical protein ACXWUG_22345 [Polyangiales bacterium]